MSIANPSTYAIGIIGLTHLSLLTAIVLWRTIRFLSYCETKYFSSFHFKKKIFFHILLLLAALVDIPMYISFVIYNDYTLILYSFHRFESALVFSAFSITISDWGALLLDIQEFKSSYLFLLRKASLLVINIVYFLISALNFAFCYSLSDFDTYLNSPTNIAGIFIQIFVTMLLAFFMLHAGLKLSWRLKGASGDQTNSGFQDIFSAWLKRPTRKSLLGSEKPYSGAISGITTRSTATANAKEFHSAIRTLNIVMGTCTVCIFLQASIFFFCSSKL